MTETFCRPDAKHWCIECCPIEGCCLLGKLSDGSRGCLGHPSNRPTNERVLPQRPLCRDFNCKSKYPKIGDQESQAVVDLIRTLPNGQFKLSEVISMYLESHLKP